MDHRTTGTAPRTGILAPRSAGRARRAASALLLVASAACTAAPSPAPVDTTAPAAVRTVGNGFVVTAKNGAERTFVDELVEGDLRATHRLAGFVEGIDAFVVHRQYAVEGGEYLLVEAGTGRVTRIDAPPIPSPDGARFATASLDMVAGHAPNRIRVYRMEAYGPELEWEVEPRGWGAEHVAWRDARTLEVQRATLDWITYDTRTSPMLLRRDRGRWTMETTAQNAADALLSFFSALGGGHFVEATLLYGGSYDVLRGWNPELGPDDLPNLWRAACEHNGLQCLPHMEVLRTEHASPSEVRVTVRFRTADGRVFAQGPCCGEEASAGSPPRTEFAFSVRREADRWLVQDLPVYVP